MTDIPNCSTCTLKQCPDDTMMDDFGASGEESVKLLKKVGCLSHPDARAYLMAPVIEELERLSNQNVGSQYKYALGEAISLIQNGVK